MRSRFSKNITPHVQSELQQATAGIQQQHFEQAFTHLETAHVLGQASTRWHVIVHWHMLLWGVRAGNAKEVRGQLLRLIGAATKTVFGLVPQGNTGGTNVSPFKVMPVDPHLASIIQAATRL